MNECNKPAVSQSPQPCAFSHDSAHRAPEKTALEPPPAAHGWQMCPVALKVVKLHVRTHILSCSHRSRRSGTTGPHSCSVPAGEWPSPGTRQGLSRSSVSSTLSCLPDADTNANCYFATWAVVVMPPMTRKRGSLRIYWTWTPGAPRDDCLTSSKSRLLHPASLCLSSFLCELGDPQSSRIDEEAWGGGAW